MHPRYGEQQLPTRLKGLDPDARYRVSEICLMPGRKSSLACSGRTFTGDYLMKVGLTLTSSGELVSHIVELKAEP